MATDREKFESRLVFHLTRDSRGAAKPCQSTRSGIMLDTAMAEHRGNPENPRRAWSAVPC